jgi:deoxyribodipyrimidine photolyase-like uncharacterized protein
MQAFFLLSHQLFLDVVKQPRYTVIFLVEDARLFKHKANPSFAIFHRAALQAVREKLLVKGFPVEYLGADEYPQLDDAIAHVATQHPEVARFFTLGDSHLERHLRTLLKKHNIPFKELASPTQHVQYKMRPTLFPEIFNPIEPNRYVHDAAAYVSDIMPDGYELDFAYPVTPGDAEEWLDDLPALLHAGHAPEAIMRDLAPLLNTGLISMDDLRGLLSESGAINLPQGTRLLSLLT